MSISCIIVEDEPLARQLMQSHVVKTPELKLMASFSDPVEAIAYLRENPVDLLFSDIQMPGITGIALLKILKKPPLVVFTTAYSEYALEGYELDVVDYLIKPIPFGRFLKSVEKVASRLSNSLQSEKDDFIFVKDGTKYVRVNLDDILYIESLKDYVALHLPDRKILSLQTMKSLESTLPASRFVRIHNSYIVAIPALHSIEKEKVLIGNQYLPVSETYKKALRDLIEKKQIGGR